jgi:hypothetical protein
VVISHFCYSFVITYAGILLGSQLVNGFCFTRATIGFVASPFRNCRAGPGLLRSRWLSKAIYVGVLFGGCWPFRFARGTIVLEYRPHSFNTTNGTSCHYRDFIPAIEVFSEALIGRGLSEWEEGCHAL